MSIRDSRARSRRRLGGAPFGPGPVPHSTRARRHNKLSLRRRRRIRSDEVIASEVLVSEIPVVASDRGAGLAPQRLSELTGLTPTMEKQLHGMGQTRFFQVAHWTGAMLDEVASRLGLDASQIQASNWIVQARRRG